MPQFDASGIVEALECKLKPYVDFDEVIPEPTDAQVGAFIAAMRQVLQEARDKAGRVGEVDMNDPTQVAEALGDIAGDGAKEFTDSAERTAEIYAALCSDKPSKSQILAVPPRARALLFQWLQKEVMSPEAAAPAGSGQVRTLPRRQTA
jgi:hypothetical protein